MFRRKQVIDLGGYNEFFYYCQDHELWIRLSEIHKLHNLPEVLYGFRQHAGNVRVRDGRLSSLYQLLVLKIARNEVGSETMGKLRITGIDSFYGYLNTSEKSFFHKSLAHMHMFSDSHRYAKLEYLKSLRYDPFDYKVVLNLLLAYFGKTAWKHFHSR